MAYYRNGRGGLHGLGTDDSTQCSSIPIGDPYRKPGNYCATPDGGATTFNADGSTYRAPGAVDPDPAHPAGASSGDVISKIFGGLSSILGQKPPVAMPLPVDTGMSTTTKLALAGGALLVVAMIARNR